MVRLSAIDADLPHEIWAKCEFANPTGSVKDRIGAHIVARAEEEGLLVPGRSVLVEATAGNTGAALAAAAAGRGYRVVVTMSSKMGPEKIALMRSWGAEVVIAPYDVAPDDPASFINTARRIAAEEPYGYYVDQFSNPWNTEAHYLTTGAEIYDAMQGRVGAFVHGVGTGGTFSGVVRHLRERGLPVRAVLADPVGSILANAVDGAARPAGPYLVEGIGGDFFPGLFDPSLVTDAERVEDAAAVAMCLRLQRDEGLSVGGSTGCAVEAAVRFARRWDAPRSRIVVILADGGTRYTSTIFDHEWRAARLGSRGPVTTEVTL